MDKVYDDPYKITQEFIDGVCIPRWEGDTAKGMSEFITKCMIHSFLEKADFNSFKKVYLKM